MKQKRNMKKPRIIMMIMLVFTVFSVFILTKDKKDAAYANEDEKEVDEIYFNSSESAVVIPELSGGEYRTDSNGEEYWYYYGFDYSPHYYDSDIYDNYFEYYINFISKNFDIDIFYKDSTVDTFVWKQGMVDTPMGKQPEWGLFNDAGERVTFDLKETNQETDHWDKDSENYAIYNIYKVIDGDNSTDRVLLGTAQMPVYITGGSNIETVSYVPDEKIKMYECTEELVDANGQKYHHYRYYSIPSGKVYVVYKGDDPNKPTEYTEFPYECSDTQEVDHWKKGKDNYIQLTVWGQTVQVPVEIIDNPVVSVECELKNDLTMKLHEDWLQKDENGKYYSMSTNAIEMMPINLKDIKATVKLRDNTELKFDSCAALPYVYYNDVQYSLSPKEIPGRWTEGETSYFYIDCMGILSDPIPFSVALNHEYSKPTWTWTGSTKATATFTCTGDICAAEGGNPQTVDATITSEVIEKATCDTAGKKIVTATVEFNGQTYTNRKTVKIAAKGHNYGAPTWKWTGTSKAVATFTCRRDESHYRKRIAEITSKITQKATLTKAGVMTYTATATLDDKTYKTTKQAAYYLFDKTKTGLQNYDGVLYYARKGVRDTEIITFAEYKGYWYYVYHGKVNTSLTGIYKGKVNGVSGSWYVKKGRVQLTYSGTVKIDGKSYKIQGGKVVK